MHNIHLPRKNLSIAKAAAISAVDRREDAVYMPGVPAVLATKKLAQGPRAKWRC